jgi:polyhydroxyalkanoate synthesis regulator phasin
MKLREEILNLYWDNENKITSLANKLNVLVDDIVNNIDYYEEHTLNALTELLKQKEFILIMMDGFKNE